MRAGERRRRECHGRGDRASPPKGRPPRSGRIRFTRMLPIAVPIQDVVDQVHDARERAEDGEAGRCACDGLRVEQLDGKEQRREDEQVLGPLARPQGKEQGECRRTAARCSGPGAGRNIGNRHGRKGAARHLAR